MEGRDEGAGQQGMRRGRPHKGPAAAQVFAQPIFETAEGWIRSGKYSLADRPALMRIVVRCSYVALTCFAAILIPFFGDLMGCSCCWLSVYPIRVASISAWRTRLMGTLSYC